MHCEEKFAHVHTLGQQTCENPTSETRCNVVCHQGIGCDVHMHGDGHSKRPVCCFMKQAVLQASSKASPKSIWLEYGIHVRQ